MTVTNVDYDAVVVGGGPAGATAAQELAEAQNGGQAASGERNGRYAQLLIINMSIAMQWLRRWAHRDAKRAETSLLGHQRRTPAGCCFQL